MRSRCSLWIFGLCAACAMSCAPAIARGAEAVPIGRVAFNRDIRPILAHNCLDCHAAETHKSGLRLDLRDVATKPLKSGQTAIVPGKPDASELVARITSNDEDQRMPPVESDHKLSARQIDLLKRWIDQGAEYEGHWGFSAPLRSSMPTVKDERWCRN